MSDWIESVKARLRAAKSDLVLGNAQTRTDLDKAIRIIECYERALEKYKFKLENAGAYIVEDHFEEPWHCELLRYVHDSLAEAAKIKEEK